MHEDGVSVCPCVSVWVCVYLGVVYLWGCVYVGGRVYLGVVCTWGVVFFGGLCVLLRQNYSDKMGQAPPKPIEELPQRK